MNHRSLCLEVLCNTKACFLFLQSKNLVPPNPSCDECGRTMKIYIRGNNSIKFRCQGFAIGDKRKHDRRINALNGTFFEGGRFGLTNIVPLIYFFSKNMTNYQFLQEECSDPDIETSFSTISDWLSFCREACSVWIDRNFVEQDPLEILGGKGVTVEIEKCRIGRRRFNCGSWREGQWIMVFIEIDDNVELEQRQSGRFRIEVLSDYENDTSIVIPLVLKHVLQDSTVVTDRCGSYDSLSSLGYHHLVVNDVIQSEDSFTGASCREKVEFSWTASKRTLRNDVLEECLADHLFEFLYRREVDRMKFDRFDCMLSAITSMYQYTDDIL